MCPLVSQRHTHYLEMKWNCYGSNENSKKKFFRLSDSFLRIQMKCLRKAESRTLNLYDDQSMKHTQGGHDSPFSSGGVKVGYDAFGEAVFPWLSSLQKHVTAFPLGYLFKDVWRTTALKHRNTVSLWGRGQICFLTNIIKMFPSGTKVGHIWACSPLVRVRIS